MFKQGEIISVKWYMGVQHDGIFTSAGTVISASARTGKVVEEHIDIFSDNKLVISKGYPSKLSPEQVEKNARARLGKKYNILSYNCQHFASECHGQKKSRQLRSVLWGVGISALALSIALVKAKGKRGA